MVEVGCRVTHDGLNALAKTIGVSKSVLEKQLRLYRSAGLIVNSYKGNIGKAGLCRIQRFTVLARKKWKIATPT